LGFGIGTPFPLKGEVSTKPGQLHISKAFMIDLLIMKAEAIQGLGALIRDMQAAVERRRGWVG
jgi:hypothetical protein